VLGSRAVPCNLQLLGVATRRNDRRPRLAQDVRTVAARGHAHGIPTAPLTRTTAPITTAPSAAAGGRTASAAATSEATAMLRAILLRHRDSSSPDPRASSGSDANGNDP
jgi:hypothetical protein